MRLLHTSDWHLGRSFHGASLLDAQRTVLAEIIEITATRGVDVVLVSGDIYDRALPQVDAVNLFNWALGRLRATGATVVVTSGNHDSASRLGFAAELIDASGVHIIADLERMQAPVLLDAADHQVAIYGIPYLEPRMVKDQLEVEHSSHAAVVGAAVKLLAADLEQRRAGSAVPVVSIAMAHLFAAGGLGSDSERELSTGNLDVVPVELFEPFDYTALGHLHGRQRTAELVRYSGSPLAYSFSEARQAKGVWLVDTGAQGITGIEEVLLPVPKALAILSGKREDRLADPAHAWAEDAWCQVTLTDDERPADAMNRIRTRFADTVVLAFAPQHPATGQEQSYSQRLAAAQSTEEVVDGFISHVRSRSVDEHESALISQVIAATREAGER